MPDEAAGGAGNDPKDGSAAGGAGNGAKDGSAAGGAGNGAKDGSAAGGAGNGAKDGGAAGGAGNGAKDGGAAGGAGNGAKTVNLVQLTNEELPDKSARVLTPPLVRIGLVLALVVFGLICTSTVMIFVVAFGFTKAVDPPGALYYFDSASVERYQRAVEMYKQVGDIPLQRAKDLFQLVVITAFLPSFTAILGYIFGTRGGSSGGSGTNSGS